MEGREAFGPGQQAGRGGCQLVFLRHGVSEAQTSPSHVPPANGPREARGPFLSCRHTQLPFVSTRLISPAEAWKIVPATNLGICRVMTPEMGDGALSLRRLGVSDRDSLTNRKYI